ncbi:MAG: enoyl-CoA hydratase/isomerase family protein [Proteobacteria bacterium]|nr:enoyl-CoA hydratase/isomerase family protein [Pseudomonadota bacterium]
MLTITFNRPKALNALSPDVVAEFARCVTQAEEDDEVRVVLITGAGKAFIAGADISVMQHFGPLQAKWAASQGQAALFQLEKMPKPVIAVVNGFALGGGCELAMACDFVYASEKARFGQPEINLGIIPGFGGTQRLPRLVGKGRAKELSMTGDMISAAEAMRIGLVNKVFPPDQLMDEAKKAALKIASKGRVALREIKQLIDLGPEIDLKSAMLMEANAFGVCFGSEDAVHGLKAFLAKEKPEFTGKLK